MVDCFESYLFCRQGDWPLTGLKWRRTILTGRTGSSLCLRLDNSIRRRLRSPVFWGTLQNDDRPCSQSVTMNAGDRMSFCRLSHPVWRVDGGQSVQVCHGELQTSLPQVVIYVDHPCQSRGATKCISPRLERGGGTCGRLVRLLNLI